MSQAVLALCSLAALWLALDGRVEHRRLAPFVGLAGQPFWFIESLRLGATGMLVATVAYTLVYLVHAVPLHWLPERLRRLRA